MKVIRKIKSLIFTLLGKITLNEFGPDLKVNGYSRFTKNTFVGKNCHFNGFKVQGKGCVRIGDNFHSGAECEIITDTHNYEGTSLPYDDTYIVRPVSIGDNVWLGKRVMILGGVSIGEGAIIQAGSVVVSDIPSCAIAGGHPARVFSKRDREKYIRLSKLGCLN